MLFAVRLLTLVAIAMTTLLGVSSGPLFGNEDKDVYFYAYNLFDDSVNQLGPAVSTVGYGETIVFDSVSENVGGGYDERTGVFTCPSEGTYYFVADMLVEDDDKAGTSLLFNDIAFNTAVKRNENNPTNANEFVENSLTIYLRKGDTIKVAAATDSQFRWFHDEDVFDLDSSFFGVKIMEEH